MKYTVKMTSQFKKDYKNAVKKHLPVEQLDKVIVMLANGETLPEQYRDHSLHGKWKNHRECHILPDWVLVYHIQENILVLTLSAAGSHSDLF